jgi:hypothetical protein
MSSFPDSATATWTYFQGVVEELSGLGGLVPAPHFGHLDDRRLVLRRFRQTPQELLQEVKKTFFVEMEQHL